ncbi:MAG: propanediol utilization protein, partial [Paracoccaceae bacterium]|nr:propanediol utilization protein [Paracoccaceae bacterium]
MTATSARVSGHFGELLQGRMGTSGPVALITLPCPVLAAHATWRPGAFALHQPGAKVLQPRVARAFLSGLGLRPSGRFTLRLDMPPGGGAGASTAALVALAQAAGMADAACITKACHAIEGATDPLLFHAPERVLWASRLGVPLSSLPPLPRMDILGGFWGPPQATDPTDCAFPDIADLVAEWPTACASPTAIARLASLSASRTIALRGPRNDPTAD